MIVIAGQENAPIDMAGLSDLEREIVRQKERSSNVYRYDSEADLRFELGLRSRIVAAAGALNASGARFAPFERSRCDERFWTRTEAGGFRLNAGVTPAAGIRDIYANGSSYAFECATATVIVLYRAILETIGDEKFNAYFPDLLLYDWQYDNDLRLLPTEAGATYPGDLLYFRNPDHAPDRPEWQGENVVKLGDDRYYAHGIGFGSAQRIIGALNRTRKPGSNVSAYLNDEAFRVDAEHIRELSLRSGLRARLRPRPDPIVARIGATRYYC